MLADPSFTHPALFYRGDREYVLATTAFIREGLRLGEPVAVSVPGPNLELIEKELGADDASTVRLMDMTLAGRNPSRIIPAVLRDFADRHPNEHVRIIGEPIWAGRSATEMPACAQHEALINLAFAGRNVTILCPYDADRLDQDVLDEAARTHPVLQDKSGTWESDAYAPEWVIERHNRPLPEPAVAAILDFDSTNLAAARDLGAEQATSMRFSPARVDDIRLVIAELGANSLDHGGGRGRIRVWNEGSLLVCEVTDSGHITDPLVGRSPVDPRAAGSRGLLIVNLLSDLVRIHTRSGSTTVRTYFDLDAGML